MNSFPREQSRAKMKEKWTMDKGKHDESNSNFVMETSEKVSSIKKRNLGRAARRRRKKILEIVKAEAEFTATAAASAAASACKSPSTGKEGSCLLQSTSALPTDRSNLRQPVVDLRASLGWKPNDEHLLVKQLGFMPGNAIRICCRVGTMGTKNSNDIQKALTKLNVVVEEPVVVQLYPLAVRDEFTGGKGDGRRFKSRKRKRTTSSNNSEDDNSHADTPSNETEENVSKDSDKKFATVLEPFPTMYWLTHQLLRLWVSKLEVSGFGVELEKRLQENSAALERMKLAHLAYGRARLELLTNQDRQEAKDRKWEYAIGETRGVAGIRNPAAVKCLHAHAAHHLSGDAGSQDNVIGAWVMEAICEMIHKGKEETRC